MKLYLSFLLLFTFLTINAQDYQRMPVISKVTATWCPNCGSWGWDYMEALKQEFGDASALLLGVHHSGDLENPVSDWFSKNLRNSYQPQFFLNNQQQGVNSGNWTSKVAEMRQTVDALRQDQADSAFEIDVWINENDELKVNVDLAPLNKADGDFFLASYIFENNVINYQSQQGQNAIHPNVLRDVISDNFWGDSYDGSTPSVFKSYSLAGKNWDQIGVVTIMWKKEGNYYIMDNAAFTSEINLLLSNDEVLNDDRFEISHRNELVQISNNDNNTYNVMLMNIRGEKIQSKKLTKNVEMDVTNLPSGIYIIHIQNKLGYFSQKIYLR